ncbi:MAG: hypothetical protein ACO25L_07170, partial [Candidatus Nanopelagicales bacterium]
MKEIKTIIKAIEKLYPQIKGGYTIWQDRTNFDEMLVWENTEFPKPTWEQIEPLLPTIELEKAKETKKNLLFENYNNAIAKPHPIEKAPL